MNTFYKYCSRTFGFAALLVVTLVSGCLDSGGGGTTTTTGTAPTVTETTPADKAIDIPLNRKVVATFSEAMDASTIDSTSFSVEGAGEAAMVGTVSYDAASKTAAFAHSSNFSASTVYTASVSGNVQSAAGKNLGANHNWTFTSGTTVDTTAPTVISTAPADTNTGVALNVAVTANFSEPLDPVTVKGTTFTLKQGTTSIDGTVSYTNKVATFTPTSNLTASTVYTATLTTGISDLTDNLLAANLVWSFTTGSSVALGPDPVNLRSAANYVILAKTTITTTGATAVTGHLGLYPAALSFITGFSLVADSTNVFSTSSLVTGKVYGANSAVPTPANLLAATDDVNTAYNDAAGRPTPDYTDLHGGSIGSQTLVPGLYKWGTNVLINTDVTLNGGANDVWIFQISGDVIQASGTNVFLTGGALAKNVFWQVSGGSGVTINTNAVFKGVALTATAITLKTGATYNGRLLARTAVILDASTVTQP